MSEINYQDVIDMIQERLNKMDAMGWSNFDEGEMHEYLDLVNQRKGAELFRQQEINHYHQEEASVGLL